MESVCGHKPSSIQRDIELRGLRELGSSVVQQLGLLGNAHPEMVSTMQLLFSQAGLPPAPSPAPSSRASSQASSARSSVSERNAASRLSATPTVPLQTITVDITGSGLISGGSADTTPRPGNQLKANLTGANIISFSIFVQVCLLVVARALWGGNPNPPLQNPV